ncbi:hypothetical protein RQP46_002594 [Phenoliferia psychrophenolica]
MHKAASPASPASWILARSKPKARCQPCREAHKRCEGTATGAPFPCKPCSDMGEECPGPPTPPTGRRAYRGKNAVLEEIRRSDAVEINLSPSSTRSRIESVERKVALFYDLYKSCQATWHRDDFLDGAGFLGHGISRLIQELARGKPFDPHRTSAHDALAQLKFMLVSYEGAKYTSHSAVTSDSMYRLSVISQFRNELVSAVDEQFERTARDYDPRNLEHLYELVNLILESLEGFNSCAPSRFHTRMDELRWRFVQRLAPFSSNTYDSLWNHKSINLFVGHGFHAAVVQGAPLKLRVQIETRYQWSPARAFARIKAGLRRMQELTLAEQDQLGSDLELLLWRHLHVTEFQTRTGSPSSFDVSLTKPSPCAAELPFREDLIFSLVHEILSSRPWIVVSMIIAKWARHFFPCLLQRGWPMGAGQSIGSHAVLAMDYINLVNDLFHRAPNEPFLLLHLVMLETQTQCSIVRTFVDLSVWMQESSIDLGFSLADSIESLGRFQIIILVYRNNSGWYDVALEVLEKGLARLEVLQDAGIVVAKTLEEI